VNQKAPATIVELTSRNQAEAAACREWRKAMHLTLAQLSAASGWSTQQIRDFEHGYHRSGLPIVEEDWRKYRLTCAALNRDLQGWNWEPNPLVEIEVGW
jgi:transcriptional regulator with XRE-family HTH domain